MHYICHKLKSVQNTSFFLQSIVYTQLFITNYSYIRFVYNGYKCLMCNFFHTTLTSNLCKIPWFKVCVCMFIMPIIYVRYHDSYIIICSKLVYSPHPIIIYLCRYMGSRPIFCMYIHYRYDHLL